MGRIIGMKGLCENEGRSESTILGLIRNEDYPATKIAGEWEANTELIEKWRRGRIEEGVKTNGGGLESVAPETSAFDESHRFHFHNNEACPKLNEKTGKAASKKKSQKSK